MRRAFCEVRPGVVVGFSAVSGSQARIYSRKLEGKGGEASFGDDGQLHHLLISRGRHETKYSITLVRCVI
jgi:hypothetical protein